MSVPIILYGSEIWTIRKIIKRIYFNGDEISQKNCWLHPFSTTKRNEEILEELNAEPAADKLRR